MNDHLYTRWFLALGATHLCFTMGMGLFYLFPIFLKNSGADKADIGLIMGIWALAAVLARPLASWLIEHLGRKRTIRVGAVLFVLSPLCYLAFKGPLSGYYWPLLGVRVVHGIGLSICMTTPFTWVADLIPPGRLNEGLGMFGAAGLITMAVGPVVGELIIAQTGFWLLFVTASGLSLIPFFLIRNIPDADIGNETGSPQPAESFLSVMVRPDAMPLYLLAALFGLGMASTVNFVTLYAQQRGVPLVSVFFIAFSTAAILTRFFGGRLADRVGERKVIPFGLVVSALGFLGLIPARNVYHFLLTGLAVGLAHGITYPSLTTLVIRDKPYSIRPKLMAIYTGSVDGGIFVGSLLLGWIAEARGFGALYLTAALAALAGLFIFRIHTRSAGPDN